VNGSTSGGCRLGGMKVVGGEGSKSHVAVPMVVIIGLVMGVGLRCWRDEVTR